jgi:hypothetical protein
MRKAKWRPPCPSGDLWKLGRDGWHILLGDRGPERGLHSWLEYGDAAVDTTFDKILSVGGITTACRRSARPAGSGVRAGPGRPLRLPALTQVVVVQA